jgi:hypothetical protein
MGAPRPRPPWLSPQRELGACAPLALGRWTATTARATHADASLELPAARPHACPPRADGYGTPDHARRRAERLQPQQRTELVRARVASGKSGNASMCHRAQLLRRLVDWRWASRTGTDPLTVLRTRCARTGRRSGRPRRSRQRASCRRVPRRPLTSYAFVIVRGAHVDAVEAREELLSCTMCYYVHIPTFVIRRDQQYLGRSLRMEFFHSRNASALSRDCDPRPPPPPGPSRDPGPNADHARRLRARALVPPPTRPRSTRPRPRLPACARARPQSSSAR